MVLAREIVAFANENKYKPNMEAIARYREEHGEDARLVYVSGLIRDPSATGSTNGPEYSIYLDNSRWVEELAKKYKELFAERVEGVRLKLVELNVLSPDESWYTKFFMSEMRIRMVSSYLLTSAFAAEGIPMNPAARAYTEFPSAGLDDLMSRVAAIDL
jgi:hypothetical protein